MITLHAEKCSIMKSHSPTKALKGYGDGKKKKTFQSFYIVGNCVSRKTLWKTFLMEIINNTMIIDLCLTRKYSFSLSTYKKKRCLIQYVTCHFFAIICKMY